MTWLLVLACLTFCFTVGFTARYKEQIVDLKTQKLEDKENFDKEVLSLLQEINSLKSELDTLKNGGRVYGRP